MGDNCGSLVFGVVQVVGRRWSRANQGSGQQWQTGRNRARVRGWGFVVVASGAGEVRRLGVAAMVHLFDGGGHDGGRKRRRSGVKCRGKQGVNRGDRLGVLWSPATWRVFGGGLRGR